MSYISKVERDVLEETFDRYSCYRPTVFDQTDVGGEENGISDFYVMPVSRNRDSRCLEESNFHCFVNSLGGESSYVQVHSFGHWANGWFELILVSPGARKTLQEAYELAGALQYYPVLDDEDHSSREYEAAQEYWGNMSLQERIDDCKKNGISFLQARHDELPQGIEYSGWGL